MNIVSFGEEVRTMTSRKVKSGSTGKTDDVTSSGRQFIDFVAKSLNTEASRIYNVKVNMKKIVVNFWMVVFCLAAICFVLPVISTIPFLVLSLLCAICAGLLRKLSKAM